MQDIPNSIEGKKKQIMMGGAWLMSNYTMRDDDYLNTDGDDYINVEIKKVTPKQQQHKTEAQLMENVCNFMITKIVKIEKKQQTKLREAKKTYSCATMRTEWLHVLLNMSIKNQSKAQHLNHLNT